ncbi:unnamed protein product [Ceratitis capitata]|uniref:(Mediterranean fruit fly) hypothetical protein n=1 Tax=Ceratitis capitata TaxID=7213 RepID=A0A811UCI5_CERCA|nr:unnamed protein product [Ceratitis capitata]
MLGNKKANNKFHNDEVYELKYNCCSVKELDLRMQLLAYFFVYFQHLETVRVCSPYIIHTYYIVSYLFNIQNFIEPLLQLNVQNTTMKVAAIYSHRNQLIKFHGNPTQLCANSHLKSIEGAT